MNRRRLRHLLGPTARSQDILELLDLPVHDPAELRESLHDMEWFLTKIGLSSRILAQFRRAVSDRRNHKRPFRILDIGTGSGWLARLLLDAAHRSDIEAAVTALDINPTVLDYARERTVNWRQHSTMKFRLGDARKLEFDSDTFEFVVCSSMLHHIRTEEAGQVIREINRVCDGTWIICDLRRRAGAYLVAKLATSIFSANRMTLHDGPLSFKRAFSFRELEDLARTCGISGVSCEEWGPLCLALVQKKEY